MKTFAGMALVAAAMLTFLSGSGGRAAEMSGTGAEVTIDQKAPAEIEKITAPFEMPPLARPAFPDRTFGIVQFGANGDGKTKNTEAFRKAIEACSAAGGGTVLVPEGKWLTGAIHLKSRVNLRLEKGAEIHFSSDPNDYLPAVFTRWAGQELWNYSPLIYAVDCEDIAVTGPGKLFGHGKSWWGWMDAGNKTAANVYREQVLKDVPPEKRIYGTREAALRPQFVSPTRCKNVLLEGFTIAGAGPFWTMDIIYCENVIMRGLKIDVVGAWNTDGIDIDSSRNVLIEYCWISSDDDCIALKSGLNEDGRRVARPTENVVIRNVSICRSPVGALAIGSDMSGGVRNVLVSDCQFTDTGKGLFLKSNASRGGVVEKIWFQNLQMNNIRQEMMLLDANYNSFMASQNGKAYPLFRDITVKDVTCSGASRAAYVQGTSQRPVENLSFENVTVKAGSGMKLSRINGLKLKSVVVEPGTGEPFMIGDCQDVKRE